MTAAPHASRSGPHRVVTVTRCGPLSPAHATACTTPTGSQESCCRPARPHSPGSSAGASPSRSSSSRSSSSKGSSSRGSSSGGSCPGGHGHLGLADRTGPVGPVGKPGGPCGPCGPGGPGGPPPGGSAEEQGEYLL